MNVLIAGIGNIFLGDDGFGVEVAQRLNAKALPDGVSVRDFGIRSIDLGFALTGGIDAAILVDTVQRGGPPGSVYLIEPEPGAAAEDAVALSPHTMDPREVLRWSAHAGGGRRVLLVGCEPESFGIEDDAPGRMGLSAPVEAAVPQAIALIEEVLGQILHSEGVDDVAQAGRAG